MLALSRDLVQSVCKDLLADLDRFEFRGEEAFRGWLYTAVLNKVRNRERDLRAERHDARREAPLDHAASSAPSDAGLAACYARVLSPLRQLLGDERVLRLEAALDELPEHYRVVIGLSRLARLGRAQVAAQMGRSEASVLSDNYSWALTTTRSVHPGISG